MPQCSLLGSFLTLKSFGTVSGHVQQRLLLGGDLTLISVWYSQWPCATVFTVGSDLIPTVFTVGSDLILILYGTVGGHVPYCLLLDSNLTLTSAWHSQRPCAAAFTVT
jgi:hypothetical protein